jgi:hypothetical protein
MPTRLSQLSQMLRPILPPMQNTNDQDILADDPIYHDVNPERVKPHWRGKFVALSRGARIGGEKIERSLQSAMVFLGLAQPELRGAAAKNGCDVRLGRIRQAIAQTIPYRAP